MVVDTCVWIDFLAGQPVSHLEDALERAVVVLSPIVIAELVSGARRSHDRTAIIELVGTLPVHETPIDHWIRVGELRLALATRGISVSTPDAHVAQCAIDRDAMLLSRDEIFTRIASVTTLRLLSP